MRKPLNPNTFRSSSHPSCSESMLKRSRRLRYDEPLSSEPSWSESAGDLASDALEFDMDVTGAGAVGGASPIRPTQMSASQGVQPPVNSGLVAPQDEVQISSAARALGQIDAGSQIHEARLAEIRAAIADGTYDTPERLEAAVERLVAALRSE